MLCSPTGRFTEAVVTSRQRTLEKFLQRVASRPDHRTSSEWANTPAAVVFGFLVKRCIVHVPHMHCLLPPLRIFHQLSGGT